MVDTDRITGAAKELGGKVQGTVGDLTGSKRDSAEGRAREAAGQAENLYGQAKDTVRDAAEHVSDTARDIGGRIRDTVGGLVGSDDVEDRARRAQGAAEDHFDRTRRSVRHAADAASDYAEEAYERGGHYLRRGTGSVSHQVAEFPLASLLIAGAVGFGLGLLVNATRD
ncbi:CsbD family protein [Methylobacterium sp. J-070]|uniref:CsbD family protein n=1 Tax=Methylobacterium sp. J-070 TaxID=2836650 RepID=UPI001FBAE7AE|nr:CsbD family protein [Methylobacterium sp. J-070]MCJ2050432.1 CsbD family protein [Methylobacterium sp. J-070]